MVAHLIPFASNATLLGQLYIAGFVFVFVFGFVFIFSPFYFDGGAS